MQSFTCSMLSLLFILSFSITSTTSRFHLESDLNTDFIRASCETTRYADLCVKTLSPFASSVQTSQTELANAALTVSLRAARATAKAVMELASGQGLSMRDGQAVADCVENMSDSVDEMQRSMVAMRDLDGPDFKEKMGNVMTWVSAALTDEDTCMDGFDGNGGKKDGKLKNTIRGYIVNVAELTSIALALINNISSN